jgi:hypothetical protein
MKYVFDKYYDTLDPSVKAEYEKAKASKERGAQ